MIDQPFNAWNLPGRPNRTSTEPRLAPLNNDNPSSLSSTQNLRSTPSKRPTISRLAQFRGHNKRAWTLTGPCFRGGPTVIRLF
jgi:hypothetical protein